MRLLDAFPSVSPAVSGLYLSVASTACASAMGIVVKLAGQRVSLAVSPPPARRLPPRHRCRHPIEGLKHLPVLQGGIPVMELVLARSLVLLCLSTFMLAREGRQAEWPWRSAR